MTQTHNLHTFTVGKFQISPFFKETLDGDFSASLSIRSGQGRSSHDRVFRFVPRFATPDGALRYARTEGYAWLRKHRPACAGQSRNAGI